MAELNYTFEPYKKNGSPRRYVGLWRPPFEEVLEDAPQYQPTYMPSQFERWQRGDFDRPLYEDDSEETETES